MSVTHEDTIRELARLKQVQRDLPEGARSELEPTLELLRSSIPPAVKKSVAARVFGVSQNALERWLNAGEIATIRTPSGRTEISVSELVELLDDMAELDELSRPLAAAIGRRRDRSARALTVDLLPWRPEGEPDGHREAELRGLAYHRAVGKRLTTTLVDSARRRLERWQTEGRVHPVWASAWMTLLDEPVDRIREVIGEDSQRGADLRQSSPFAGALSDHERRQILRAVDTTTS